MNLEELAAAASKAKGQMSLADLAAAAKQDNGPPSISPELAQQAIDNRREKDAGFGTALNKAGEAMTFGLIGDEASARVESLLPGVTYEDRLNHYRKQEDELEEQAPGAALAAEVVGGITGAAVPIGAIARSGGLASRVGKSMATGGLMGGTYGFMEGEGGFKDRLDAAQSGAAIGVGAGAAAPAAGAVVQRLADRIPRGSAIRTASRNAKTAEGQRAAARAAYDQFEEAGANVSLPAYRRIAGAMNQAMDRVNPNSAMPGPLGRPSSGSRKISRTLQAIDDEMAPFADQNPGLPLQALDDVRKEIGQIAQERVPLSNRPTRGAAAAASAKSEMDQLIDSLQPEDLVAGDRDTAISALEKARAAWAQSIKTQKVEDAIEASSEYLGGAESGLRNQIRTLLRQNKKSNLFTKEEVDVLRKIIGGSTASRAVRLVGDGIGRRMALMGGGIAGGPMGAAAGAAAGEIASQIGDSAAMRRAEIAKALISSGALQNLPKASPAARRISEELTRRLGATTTQ